MTLPTLRTPQKQGVKKLLAIRKEGEDRTRKFLRRLKKGFANKEYRHAYADEFLNESIATQIKVVREQRGWRQVDLAQAAGMKQSMVSRLENVNYSSWSIHTLRKLAWAFDLRLKVTFESFGSLAEDFQSFNRESLLRSRFHADPGFSEDTGGAIPGSPRPEFGEIQRKT